jgi:hypothetical protein
MYQASHILDKKGIIVTTDLIQLGKLIASADAEACFDEHSAKLKRVEIGIALRQAAAIPGPDGNGRTLTETIDAMGLCKTLTRAEKTMLKYARIAGSAMLLELAANPNISFSVLDEIAACKKPVDPEKRREFVRRLGSEVRDACKRESEEEGHEPDSYRGSGPTRNDVVGMIRRAQIDFAVPTKGGSERDGNKREKELLLLRRMTRLVGMYRVLFLPDLHRSDWLEKNELTIEKFGRRMRELQDELIKGGLIEEDPNTISAGRLFPGRPEVERV